MGVALLVTMTYKMVPEQAILTLMCVYLGAIYGGSRTAILLNIPGTPANAASTMDGYPLARQGKAGLAMGLATTSSTLGTLVGIFFLALIAPVLSEAALKFGSYEFFWLALFGVVISGQMSGSDTPLKGYISGIIGLLVAMVGMESLHAVQRFTFGIPQLGAGIDIIPAMVGAFGLAELLCTIKRRADRFGGRPGRPPPQGNLPVLENHHPLRHHRHGCRHHPRRGRRCGRLDVLCRGQEALQATRRIRPWQPGRPDRRRDGR
jgi:putative tricarboxylic transport membrane protein